MTGITVGIVPARCGSTEVPGKNTRPLAGRPLVAWTIEAAMQAGCLDRVIVTTDDPEVSRIATGMGADVPFQRPAQLATAEAAMPDVVRHCVGFLEEQGERIDLVGVFYPTSPFRTGGDIDAAFDAFTASTADVLLSVAPVQHGHPRWCVTLDDDGAIHKFIDDGQVFYRRQELPAAYEPDGAIYFLHREALTRVNRLMHTDRMTSYISDPIRGVDINSELDFLLAEAIAARGLNQGHDERSQAHGCAAGELPNQGSRRA